MNFSGRLVGVRALAGVIAAIALAVGAFALIRGTENNGPTPTPRTAAAPTTASRPRPSASQPSTTVTTAPADTVSVPRVVGLARDAALTDLQAAGLEAHIETLPNASTPAGFVLSQHPLPAAETGLCGVPSPGKLIVLRRYDDVLDGLLTFIEQSQ